MSDAALTIHRVPPTFPARIRAGRCTIPYVDVMCLTACNLRCVGCTSFMGQWPQEVWPAEDVERDVAAAARVMHADVACLLGGEPLAHPELMRLIRFTKASGLADEVTVSTNGMRLHKMQEEFWSEIDGLKISVYPGATQPENVQLARDKQDEHGFRLELYEADRQGFVAVLTTERRTDESARRTYDRCWHRQRSRKIERGYFYRCCVSPSISQLVLGLPPDADGLRLEGASAQDVLEFLEQPHPASSCYRCYGYMLGKNNRNNVLLGKWREERDPERWIRESMRAARI